MKKSDLRSSKAVNAKETLKNLTKDDLHNTGRAFGGIRFIEGNEITFDDWEFLQTFTDSFKDKNGGVHDYPVVKVGFGEVVRNVAISSFRRHSQGVAEFVTEYRKLNPFLDSLASAQDDYELMQACAGKVLVVKGFFPARTKAWNDARTKVLTYNADDPTTYDPDLWPIFEVKDAE